MDQKNKKSWREILGIAFIVIGTIIFIVYVFGLSTEGYLNTSVQIDPEVSSHIGSFIGGVAGSMWALGGILFLYETLYFQRKEFQATRENYLRSQKEETFFL